MLPGGWLDLSGAIGYVSPAYNAPFFPILLLLLLLLLPLLLVLLLFLLVVVVVAETMLTAI